MIEGTGKRVSIKIISAFVIVGVAIAIVLPLFGNMDPVRRQSLMPVIMLSILFLSKALFIWGCMDFAHGRGHHRGWGLIGILGLIGFGILFLVCEDRNAIKAQPAPAS